MTIEKKKRDAAKARSQSGTIGKSGDGRGKSASERVLHPSIIGKNQPRESGETFTPVEMERWLQIAENYDIDLDEEAKGYKGTRREKLENAKTQADAERIIEDMKKQDIIDEMAKRKKSEETDKQLAKIKEKVPNLIDIRRKEQIRRVNETIRKGSERDKVKRDAKIKKKLDEETWLTSVDKEKDDKAIEDVIKLSQALPFKPKANKETLGETLRGGAMTTQELMKEAKGIEDTRDVKKLLQEMKRPMSNEELKEVAKLSGMSEDELDKEQKDIYDMRRWKKASEIPDIGMMRRDMGQPIGQMFEQTDRQIRMSESVPPIGQFIDSTTSTIRDQMAKDRFAKLKEQSDVSATADIRANYEKRKIKVKDPKTGKMITQEKWVPKQEVMRELRDRQDGAIASEKIARMMSIEGPAIIDSPEMQNLRDRMTREKIAAHQYSQKLAAGRAANLYQDVIRGKLRYEALLKSSRRKKPPVGGYTAGEVERAFERRGMQMNPETNTIRWGVWSEIEDPLTGKKVRDKSKARITVDRPRNFVDIQVVAPVARYPKGREDIQREVFQILRHMNMEPIGNGLLEDLENPVIRDGYMKYYIRIQAKKRKGKMR